MASKEVSPLMSPSLEDDNMCNICNQKYRSPRILSCLHVFCEQCLEKLLWSGSTDALGLACSPTTNIIICPDCQQETKVSKHGVASLPLDYVLCNILESPTSSPSPTSSSDPKQILCTSCKTKKNAVARCSDCANFLCPSCVTAHQYMRCFENHQVVYFEDMTNGESMIVKNLVTCSSHAGELMKYFCHTCQVPLCNECVMTDHKAPDHHYNVIADVEQKQRDDLRNLMAESKSKVKYCEDASSTLESLLSELQMQHDNAKSHIEESFHSYKAMLEKRKNQLMEELGNLHSTLELNVMDTFNSVEKTIEKIEDACKFTDRLLNYGSTMEILMLKRHVGSQLLYLINNTPKTDVSINMEFVTDAKNFEEALKTSFGHFKDDSAKNTPQSSSIHSSFENEGFVLPVGVLSPDGCNVAALGVDIPTSPSLTEFTLSQLSLAVGDRLSLNPPSPTMSLADIISNASGDNLVSASSINALNNLTALAKLGTISLNNQGQITLNGQVVNGLSRDSSIGGMEAHTPNPALSPTSLQPLSSLESAASALGSLLNSGLSSQAVSSRGPSPLMDGGSLLNGSSGNQLKGLSALSDALLSSGGQGGFMGTMRNSNRKLNPVKIRCKFGQLGPNNGQFSSPHGFCLGINEDIVVADTNNHRIQLFDKNGEFLYQFGIPGKEEGQLWYPRKVAVMRTSGKFVVCDRGNERSRMQIYSKNGHFLKKIAIRYIDIVAGLAITHQGHIVAVDSVSPTVFVIAESGDLLRWFDCSDFMREPSDIAINGKEYFVCDFKGHCVVVFNEDGTFHRRIGCENITNFPNGIDISDAGDVLVGDSHGNRFHVAVFNRDGSLLSEFECPYVKVSRCCGLKITSEGYVVTLAKNNHHVLVLNTLYIM